MCFGLKGAGALQWSWGLSLHLTGLCLRQGGEAWYPQEERAFPGLVFEIDETRPTSNHVGDTER